MVERKIEVGKDSNSKEARPVDTIDTVETRKEIGFLSDPSDWVNQPAIYSVVDGQEILTIAGHPVMESWEAGYMQELADVACSKGGRVLELGYGLGLSARAIQAHSAITSHAIIEANKDVIKKGEKDLQEAITQGRAQILPGLWESVIPTLQDGSFDGIMFDTYPLTENDIHGNHFPFFQAAFRLLKPDGIFTYYSDVATKEDFLRINTPKLIKAGFSPKNISCEVCHVQPPKNCKYWKTGTIVVPIVKK